MTVGTTILTHTITGGNDYIWGLSSAFGNTLNALYPDAGFNVDYRGIGSAYYLSVTGADFAAHPFTIQRTGDTSISSAVSHDVVAPSTVTFDHTAISVLASGASAEASLYVSGATGFITSINVTESGAAGNGYDSAEATINGNFTVTDSIVVLASGADNNTSSSTDALLHLGGDVTFDTATLAVTASGYSAEASVDISNGHGTLSSITVTASNDGAIAAASFNQEAGTGTLNVGNITVTATGISAEAHLQLDAYQGRHQQQTITLATDGNGNVAAGVYTLTVDGMSVSYELLASTLTGPWGYNNYNRLRSGLGDQLEKVYGSTHLPVTLSDFYSLISGTAVLELEWNDYGDHTPTLATLTSPDTSVVHSELSQVAIAQTDTHLNNNVINVTGTGYSADATLNIANATGIITSITVDHDGNGDGSTASAEINGTFTVGNITVHSSRGSSDLALGNNSNDNVITMSGNQILVTAGILPVDVNGNSDNAYANFYAENVHGSIAEISVRTTATSVSGEATATLNGNFTLAQTTLDIVATGKDAIAALTMSGAVSGDLDLTNYDVTLTSMAIGVEASGLSSKASFDLADAVGTMTSINVIASDFNAGAYANIDFSGTLSGSITVTANATNSSADLTMTAGTPTHVTVGWVDSNYNGGVSASPAFAAGQVYTLKVGTTELSYTLATADIILNTNAATMLNLLNGLKTDGDYAGADFQLLHANNNGDRNLFEVIWNDASVVNRDTISLACNDAGTVSNMRDHDLSTNHYDDHDGTAITLSSAINITATASGAHSSADIVLDNLLGSVNTISASATGGSLIGTANFHHYAGDSGDFNGASTDVAVRITGGVSAIEITATHIEDTAGVALSQTVQGGAATVTGDGHTSLNLAYQTVDSINLAALHQGGADQWGTFNLDLSMSDAAYTNDGAGTAALTAGMVTVTGFDLDRDSINLLTPWDQTTNAWTGDTMDYRGIGYSENEVAVANFDAFLSDANTALTTNAAALPDYYFGVVGSDGYLAYDMGGTGITGVIKLAGVTSFDLVNVADRQGYNLGSSIGTINDTLIADTATAMDLRYTTGNKYSWADASTADIIFTKATHIDSLTVSSDSGFNNNYDSVNFSLMTQGTDGDIVFRQANIDVGAQSGSFNGADTVLTVSDARGTIQHLGVNADGMAGDTSSTATFMSFSGAVHEIELNAVVSDGLHNASADLNLSSQNGNLLSESVQNLWMTVESADATANLTFTSGYVVKTEVTMNSSSDMSIVTLNIEQTVHGGEVFATSHIYGGINRSADVNLNGDYQNGGHATFDLTYTGATADKVSLGQMVWDNVTNADVFTVGNFEGDFKLWLYAPDTDNADFTVSGALQTNMLTIEGFDTGATAYDDTNAWLDDRISFNNSQNGYYLKSLTDEVTVDAFLSAADTALDGTVDYYFGVVGSNGYLAMDEDGSGITQVIEFLGMTDLDYTRINGAAPVV